MARKFEPQLRPNPLGNKRVTDALNVFRQRGIALPKQYERYLRNNPAMGLMALIETKASGDFRPVDYLYGGDGQYGILEHYDSTERRNYIAIGGNLLGNKILLAWRGKHAGSVWYWDHGTAEIIELCDDFESFLAALQPEPDEPDAQPGSFVALTVSVPKSKKDTAEPIVEKLGTEAEQKKLGELSGETDTDNPPTWVWIFEVNGDKTEELRAFLKKAITRHSQLSGASVGDWNPP